MLLGLPRTVLEHRSQKSRRRLGWKSPAPPRHLDQLIPFDIVDSDEDDIFLFRHPAHRVREQSPVARVGTNLRLRSQVAKQQVRSLLTILFNKGGLPTVVDGARAHRHQQRHHHQPHKDLAEKAASPSQ